MNTTNNVANTIAELIKNGQQEINTPCYIYSVDQIISNYEALKKELDTPLIASVKANHCAELLARVGHVFSDGYEVASLGELRLRSGAKVKIFVNTPAYTKKMVEVASKYDATFIVDHYQQLDLISEVNENKKISNDLLLRLNFDSFAKTSKNKSSDHFGMDEAGLRKAIEMAKAAGLRVKGLHIFGGSNNFVKRSATVVDIAYGLLGRVSEALDYSCEMVNLGGGIPANWRELEIDFSEYRKHTQKLKEKTEVVHEAGRALFANAGYFVAEVVSRKSINGHNYVVCDGGIAQNFMLAKTEHVIRKYDSPILLTDAETSQKQSYTFVGASCNRDDVIGEVADTHKELSVGDRIMFGQCGAYNATYTVSKFLALAETKEYLI